MPVTVKTGHKTRCEFAPLLSLYSHRQPNLIGLLRGARPINPTGLVAPDILSILNADIPFIAQARKASQLVHVEFAVGA